MWKTMAVLVAGLLGGAALAAPPGGDGRLAGPVPAPPGPYQSSRPYLSPEGDGQPLPYYGAMQFPHMQHDRPYFGPGRYFDPEQPPMQTGSPFATRQLPPWGPPRPPAAGAQEPHLDPNAVDRSMTGQGYRQWGAWPPAYGRGPEGGGVP